jgi:DNA-binding CsgD family transcriptional regulator
MLRRERIWCTVVPSTVHGRRRILNPTKVGSAHPKAHLSDTKKQSTLSEGVPVRLSEHLKGKDYRQLLEIIDVAYGASSPDALFPPLFERLANAVGCTTGVFMLGESVPMLRGAYAFQTNNSAQLAREFAEYYWTLDSFWGSGLVTHPNRAFRSTDLVPTPKYLNSEFVVDFATRVPYCWGLGGTVGNPGHPIGAIALNRLRHDRDFSERDIAFLHALLPHLSRALSFFEERDSRLCGNGILILDDVGSVVYSNKAATQILKDRSATAIPLPTGRGPRQERTIFQSDQGEYSVELQKIPGPYKVVSLEPRLHNSLRSRLASMGLTARQQEIASRVVRGMSNKRIADQLGLTEQTVKDHIHSIFCKLGIHHRAELAARFLPISLNDLG